MRDPAPQITYLKDYAPPAFLVETVELDVALLEDHALVRARLSLARNPASPDPRAPLVLDAEELEFESAAIDGRPLAAQEIALGDTHLTIASPPARFTLETACRIHP